jgi:hypothetical protein
MRGPQPRGARSVVDANNVVSATFQPRFSRVLGEVQALNVDRSVEVQVWFFANCEKNYDLFPARRPGLRFPPKFPPHPLLL